MKRISVSQLVGALLVTLCGIVMLGLWLQQLPLVQVLPDYTPMVFNTALFFALALMEQ
jgi:predicted benzoate:H+ symporter BenE